MVNRREFIQKVAIVTGATGIATFEDLQSAFAHASSKGLSVELPPDDAETFNVTCQFCHVQCGYKVKVWERGKGKRPKGTYTTPLSGEWVAPTFIAPAEKDGKKVFIAVIPDKDCVVNLGDYSIRGGTAALTIFTKDFKTYEKRLKYPMIRKNKNEPLKRVSWKEAIEFTAEKLLRLKEEFGPDALGLVWGDWLYTLPTHAILKFWFVGLGSSSHMGNGWYWDEESAGISAAFGTGTRAITIEDFEQTRLLFCAGKNLMDTGSVWYHRFLMNNPNAREIYVDPRKTQQAKIAEERGGLHLQIRPGTDPILAGALIRIIIERDAWDKEFVEKYVSGFDVVKAVVRHDKFSLENASTITGIPKDKILKAADLLIENKGHTLVTGEKGIMHQMAAFEAQHGYAVMGIILGNVGKPGANVFRGAGHPKGTFWWPPEPPSREKNEHLPTALKEGRIKSIWAFGSNVFAQIPNQRELRPLIAKTFLIVQDRIHTEMDSAADVIFPAASWGETELILASEDRRIRLIQKFMDPPGEALPDWYIVAQVAKAMGLKGFDWNHPKDIWDEIRQNNDWIAEITWEMLVEAGTNGVRYPMKNGKSPERLFSDECEAILGKRFFTEDGKVHVEAFEKVLKFEPTMYEWSGVNKDYPLMAIDFRLNELWNTGYTYWFTPTLYERTPDAFCMIHPEDAKPRGIKDGDWVILRSRYGQCKAKAKVTTDIIKGCVAVPALFPKEDQKNAHILPDTPSPINGDVVTQVAVEVIKIKSDGVKKSKKER